MEFKNGTRVTTDLDTTLDKYELDTRFHPDINTTKSTLLIRTDPFDNALTDYSCKLSELEVAETLVTVEVLSKIQLNTTVSL